MRFGIDVHVIEMMVAAGLGAMLSSYLQDDRYESNTNTAVHTLAAVGAYVVAKGIYSVTRGIRNYVTPEKEVQPDSHKNKRLD